MAAKNTLTLPGRQRGAALVIGLILLLILTVLGVSGLGTSAVEVRIADNNKQKEIAFQSAESASREELTNGAAITLTGAEVPGFLMRPQSDYTYELDTGGTSNVNVEVTVDTTYRSRNPAPGYEIGTIDAVHFELDTNALAARGATSRQRQGFYIPAPSP